MLGGVLSTLDIAIVVGFLVAVTAIGWFASRAASQGVEDYFLGGNKIPWWVLGISSATSNFDMAGTMIIVAVVYSLGYQGFLVEIRGGVGLSLAFLLVFLGKWLRRSRVMTSAEWMKLRFGTDRSGRAAHLLSAIANIVLSLGMIIYFSKGAGKFLTHFIPIPDFTFAGVTITGEVVNTAVMVGVGLFYTLLSGLYGVVFTDVAQMLLLGFTAIYVTVVAYGMAPDVAYPSGMLDLSLTVDATQGGAASLVARDAAAWGPIFELFGLAVGMWVIRTVLEGMGGVGGYTDQRFFAARSEREASLLTLEAVVLSIMRWTMVAGLVVMGLHLVQSGGAGADMIRGDPEQVLPVVLSELLPSGVRGIVVAGLVAAAMSTFDSTLNAGASYIVRDIYQDYVNPSAGKDDLMRVSRWATVGLCIAGVGLAAVVPNINEIWQLITMGIGAGMFVPLFLRWYWPRLTGWGFAVGTGAGIGGALVVNTGLSWPLVQAFPTVIACALVGAVGTSLVTAPASRAVLVRFWLQINPWGMWRDVAEQAQHEGELHADEMRARATERRRDGIAVFFSVPFQLSALLASMAVVWHDWARASALGAVAVLGAAGLYWFWYRNLKSPQECAADDERWAKPRPEGD